MRKAPRFEIAAAVLVAVLLVIGWVTMRKRQERRAARAAVTATTVESDGGAAVPGSATSAPARARPPAALIPSTVREEASLAAGAFSGRVISRERATAIRGAELTFEESGAAFTVRTGEDGAFQFQPPRPGVYRLAAIHADGFLKFGPAWGHSPISLVARPGQRVDELVFQLQPARTLQGVVVRPDGKPAIGARVRILDAGEEDELTPTTGELTTDAEGAFSLQAPRGALLEATLEGFGAGRGRVGEQNLSLGQRLVLRLRPAGSELAEPQQLSGRVLDPAGVPAEGARVKAVREHPEDRPRPYESRHPEPSAAVDADGRFTLKGLDPGRYRVRATQPGFAAAELRNVPSGSADVELRLSRGATVRGRVRDAATGRAVSAFNLALDRKLGPLAREGETSAAILDGEGSFAIEGVGPGDYELRVAAFGHAVSEPVQLSVPDPVADPAPVEVRLARGGRVFGVVLDEVTRRPLAGARIELEGGVGAVATAFPVSATVASDRDGRFELTGLAEGLRSVTVTAAEHHGRILSGLQVQNDGSVGPIEVELAPTREGEEPRLEIVGIGVVLVAKDDALVVDQVIPTGGGAEAGLQRGHEVVSIDGDAVQTLGFEASVNRIRGPENSTVVVGVRRPPDTTVHAVAVPRRRIRN